MPNSESPGPCIICVAITGSVPTKADNPAVPITVEEQVESTQEAFEAGASIVHAHVRDDEGKPSSDPDRFARLKEGLETHCPGMIIQFSTGGRSGSGAARGGMLPLKPDMASLAVGSNNFPTRVYENPPDLVDWLAAEMLPARVKPEIEAFDLSHVFQAVKMAGDGRLKAPLYVQFVMGVKNAMPVDRAVFDFYVATLGGWRPTRSGAGRGSAPGRSCSTSGASRRAAMRAPGSRTTCGSTGRRSRPRTRRWCGARWSSARNTNARSRPGSRRARCWGCRSGTEATPRSQRSCRRRRSGE
jgi:3-keto-5-aminohexanoate cleavage enzyme